MAGHQLESSELVLEQRRAHPNVVLLLGQHVPDEDRQLARRCDGGDGLAALDADAMEESAQRTWARGDRPRRLDEHAAGVAAPLMRDVPVVRRMVAGLVHRWVQPEVADELLGTGEPIDVADGCQHAGGYDGVDAADGHQAFDVRIGECSLRQVPVDDGQFGRKAREFVVMTQRHPHLVRRQRQRLEPRSASFAEDPARLLRDQVGMKNRLDAVLQSRHLADQLGALGDDAALQLDVLGRHPDLRKELGRVQPGKGRGVDLVRLDLGPGDGSYLEGVGDDDATHEGRQQPDDDGRVARRLQHDVVFVGQHLVRESQDGLAFHDEAAVVLHPSAVEDRNLREVAMHVQTDDSHGRPPAVRQSRRKLAGNTTTTDPRSQRNRANRRGSQITTRARSSLSNAGLPANTCSRRPYPGARTLLRRTRSAP